MNGNQGSARHAARMRCKNSNNWLAQWARRWAVARGQAEQDKLLREKEAFFAHLRVDRAVAAGRRRELLADNREDYIPGGQP